MGKKAKKRPPERRSAASQGNENLPAVNWNIGAGEENDNRPGSGKTWAPYNFVPFSNKVLFPYPDGMDSLPGHDEIRPDLKTGEIQITMTAETPVFVSDGQRGNASFFRGANGKLMIPGSTVRGLVRENMQILGFGLIRPGEDLEDRRIYFREVAEARKTVQKRLKQYYDSPEALNVRPEPSKSGKGTITIPRNVRAGYICQENGEFVIYPTDYPTRDDPENGGGFIRIPRKHQDAVKLCTNNSGLFQDKFATVVSVTYTGEGGTLRFFPADSGGGAGDGERKKGKLLFTGKPVGKPPFTKPNSLYLFPETLRKDICITIPKEDILSYRADYEDRKNSLKAYYDVKFWDLPGEGESKPVFYARVGGHTYFGMSLFLRIGYRHTIADGLPAYQKERGGQINEALSALDNASPQNRAELLKQIPLDFPHSLLGFSFGSASYRSRVSVEDFALTAGGEHIQTISYTPGGPKPSFYPGYLRDAPREKYGLPQISPETKHYNDSSFLLRGYKQYWLRDTAVTPVPPKREDAASTVKLRLLPAGSVFTGVIRYKNLTEQELGLLLWSIRLDDSCWHSIGTGKPYGFGRMKVQIQNLLEVLPAQLYGGLTGSSPILNEAGTAADRVQRYIHSYDESAEKMLESLEETLELSVTQTDSIRNRPEIQDFLHMKSTLVQTADGDSESLYMSIDKGDYRNLTMPLPTVAQLRQTAEAKEEAANRSMEDWLAALKAKAASGRL